MLQFLNGNIFNSTAEALVNPVNIKGVMGKGLAKQFKTLFPKNFVAYQYECAVGSIQIGKLFSFYENERLIINFPTKTHWKLPSQLEFIVEGLLALDVLINDHGLKSVAIPALGTGLGGLDWSVVKLLFVEMLTNTKASIEIYEPV